MNLNIEPKDIIDAYCTPIVQQTSFWSKVKQHFTALEIASNGYYEP